MATSNMFAGSPPAMPANHGYNGPAHANFGQPTMNGNGNGAGSGNFGQPAMNGNGNGVGPGNFGQPTMNGYGNGPGYFSDGFIPPSPQIFPQSDQSMIPPGSGAFPVIANANGFTPASQAFNAMYGLPDDPFSSSQAGSPGWMSNLGNMSLANGQSGPGGSSPNPNKGNLAPGEIDINDPQIDEIIRQYSQKGQNTPQPQQHMPPAQPPQQQRMLPTRPPESVVPVVAALPLSPTPPAPPTPQREQGPNSRWLQ
jgi:hypothetical protein